MATCWRSARTPPPVPRRDRSGSRGAAAVVVLKAARVRKRRVEGRCEGRKPFGAKPGEAEVVAYIAKLRR